MTDGIDCEGLDYWIMLRAKVSLMKLSETQHYCQKCKSQADKSPELVNTLLDKKIKLIDPKKMMR